MDSSKKRLDRLETVLKRQRDPVFTVVLNDGQEITCDYETAWGFFQGGKGHLVESVAVDRDDYLESAQLLEMLCRS